MVILNPIPCVCTTLNTPQMAFDRHAEPLVPVRSSNRIQVHPQYFHLGFRQATAQILVRRRVVDALHRAGALLPGDLRLVVWDGYRTVDLQQEIRDRSVDKLRSAGMPPEVMDAYVAPVPRNSQELRNSPPSHCTGGAVDVSLASSDGQELDLGAAFDEFGERAWLRHYESDPLSDAPADVRRRNLRRVLFHAMTGAGFSAYEFEFWHYEFGTRRAAASRGLAVASYGAFDVISMGESS